MYVFHDSNITKPLSIQLFVKFRYSSFFPCKYPCKYPLSTYSSTRSYLSVNITKTGHVQCHFLRNCRGPLIMLKSNFYFLHFNQTFIRKMSTTFRSVSGPYNWINNQRVSPVDTSAGVINDIEPRSGKLLAKVPVSGTSDVDTAVQAAKKAFQSWSKVQLGLMRSQ